MNVTQTFEENNLLMNQATAIKENMGRNIEEQTLKVSSNSVEQAAVSCITLVVHVIDSSRNRPQLLVMKGLNNESK